ncbi:MAG: YrhA family protein [Alphaproteobacteria bacterium]|nr:YrhA family protein [Alphaproteobacteria bacterium]
MFENILNKMEEMGGVFKGAPLSDEGFEKLIEQLRSIKVELPDEYAELLFTADGLNWGGLEFFGSVMHVDKKRGFSVTDLFSQNRLFQALNPDRKNDVLLGHTDEESYIFNAKSKKFEIIEEFENNVLKSFSSFEELFQYVIDEQIEVVQNFVAFNEDEIKDEASDEDF